MATEHRAAALTHRTLAGVRAALAAGMTPNDLWRHAQACAAAWNDPALFIHAADGPNPIGDGPLAGVCLAVKDNIDVAGLPTTAACPGFRYLADADASAVGRLRERGALVLGKANLDQFATGLVGARSPFGTPRNPFDPALIPGGSSSGSACAVATGICPVALGTDTAGSGRVPAAFTNTVGLKPTRGLVPTRGVVPACRSLDCVSVFALTVADAWEIVQAMAGFDPDDPSSRHPQAPCQAVGSLRIGVPDAAELDGCDPAWLAAYHAVRETLRGLGHGLVSIDFAPFRETAALLYGGAFVAERTAAVGEVLGRAPAGADPTVTAIIRGGLFHDAAAAFRDLAALAQLRRRAERQWERCDVLLLPTAPQHPTLAEVAAEPVGANTRLGRFTNFANLLDTCAAAVPAGFTPAGLPAGVTLFAPAWHDLTVARLGAALQDALALPLGATGLRLCGAQGIAGDDGGVELAVFGAHLSGQPLNRELVALGARLSGTVRTSAAYRLHALRTTPPKPGLVRCAGGGAPIAGELWRLSRAAFGAFVAAVPPPLAIGSVELEDGRRVKGFLAEPAAITGSPDITAHGGWVAWLAAGAARSR